MSSPEAKKFEAIAGRLTNDDLRKSISAVIEGLPSTSLDQEVETVFRCMKRATNLILYPEPRDEDLAGIKNTRMILNQHHLNYLPNPHESTDNPRLWLRSLIETIKVVNAEAGTTYRSPEKINEGDPLSVFRWYLYDGVGRMVAIHLGISNSDKGQEKAGDWIACALTEAAVVLAESGDSKAQEVVSNMLSMGFIDKGWLLTDQLIKRAKDLNT